MTARADDLRERLHRAVDQIPASLLLPGRAVTLRCGETDTVVVYDPPKVSCEFAVGPPK